MFICNQGCFQRYMPTVTPPGRQRGACGSFAKQMLPFFGRPKKTESHLDPICDAYLKPQVKVALLVFDLLVFAGIF